MGRDLYIRSPTVFFSVMMICRSFSSNDDDATGKNFLYSNPMSVLFSSKHSVSLAVLCIRFSFFFHSLTVLCLVEGGIFVALKLCLYTQTVSVCESVSVYRMRYLSSKMARDRSMH